MSSIDKTIKPPRVFISYCWTSQQHEEWVLQLSTRLRDNYVDVILDKWDLKEGQDVYSFMESMVHAEDVAKVLVICDSGYKVKAEERIGGVGTETQIISKQVYADINQEKFIPIVAERSDKNEAFIPIYMESRKYIDMSSDGTYERGYEELLRNLFNRPVHRKTGLGSMPSWLFEDQPSHNKTANINKMIQDSLTRNPQRLPSLVNEFFENLLVDFEQFQFSFERGEKELDDIIFEKIQDMLPLRDDYILFVELQCSYQQKVDIDSFIHFFEKAMLFTMLPEGHSSSFYNEQYDHYKFIIRELFLFTVMVLIEKSQYKALSELLQSTYFVPDRYYNDLHARTYDVFDRYCKSLDENRNKRLNLRKVSISADILMKRVTEQYTKRKIVQADLLLYYFSILSETERSYVWYPRCHVYEEYYKLEFIQRLKSRRFIGKVSELFEVASIEELKGKIANFSHSHRSNSGFNDIPKITDYISIEDIGLNT